MPRTVNRLLPRIADPANLSRAIHQAAAGKRFRPEVATWLMDTESHLLRLSRALAEGRWQPSPWRQFPIRDPKPRLITAPAFGDRVVHQAIMGICGPIFARRFIAQSYACQRGKGTQAARQRFRQLLDRHRYCLRLDIRHCYPSLHHAVVRQSLRRVICCQPTLDLFNRILAAHPDPGLPIGALTSQWLANLVLDRLDHQVVETWGAGNRWVRYMDDMAWFGDDPAVLTTGLARIQAYCHEVLHLETHPNKTRLHGCVEGLAWLGFRYFPDGRRRVGKVCLQRQKARWAKVQSNWWQGRADPAAIQRSVDAWGAFVGPWWTRRLRPLQRRPDP